MRSYRRPGRELAGVGRRCGRRRHLSGGGGGDGDRAEKEGRDEPTQTLPLSRRQPTSTPPARPQHNSFLHLDKSVSPTSTHFSILKKCPDCSEIAEVGDFKKKSGTTRLGVSGGRGLGCLRGGGPRGGASVSSAASAPSSSHGGGSALRGQLHVKREGLKLPSC